MRLASIAQLHVLRSAASSPPKLEHCPICGGNRIFLKTNPGSIVGRRCILCLGTLSHQAAYAVLQDIYGRALEGIGAVYELSARGALWRALRRQSKRQGFDFVCSEFATGVPSGNVRNGVRCEDVERLTFPSASFDAVTSTGMFEHVEDDAKGFREVCRVLKPGGHTVFTVPYHDHTGTIERARRRFDGSIDHLLEPQYHYDHYRGAGAVFTWRSYGRDIVDRLAAAGMRGEVRWKVICGERVPVIVGRKPTC